MKIIISSKVFGGSQGTFPKSPLRRSGQRPAFPLPKAFQNDNMVSHFGEDVKRGYPRFLREAKTAAREAAPMLQITDKASAVAGVSFSPGLVWVYVPFFTVIFSYVVFALLCSRPNHSSLSESSVLSAEVMKP